MKGLQAQTSVKERRKGGCPTPNTTTTQQLLLMLVLRGIFSIL